ncbi:MAG: hypothetical protein K6G12_09605 [Lachnospiraceae bacterium]|nr:hypothetical protein [Lachnospiraceae bacterium]
MNKKRFISKIVLFTLICSLSITSCGKNDDTQAGTNDTGTESKTTAGLETAEAAEADAAEIPEPEKENAEADAAEIPEAETEETTEKDAVEAEKDDAKSDGASDTDESKTPDGGTDVKTEETDGTGSKTDTEEASLYTNEYEAYKDILFYYKATQSGLYTTDMMTRMGYHSALMEMGWPWGVDSGLNDDVGYAIYDIDKNCDDELIITYSGEVCDIYTFCKKQAVVAYNRSYRGEATLYEDGMLKSTFGTMDYASETWYKLNDRVGVFLPIVGKSYDPTKHESNPDDEYYYLYRLPEDWGAVEEFYEENGNVPVWAYEWDYEIRKNEYLENTSSANEVKLDISPVSEFNGF